RPGRPLLLRRGPRPRPPGHRRGGRHRPARRRRGRVGHLRPAAESRRCRPRAPRELDRHRGRAVYVPAQIAGGCAGAMVANLMFDLPAVTLSHHARSSGGLWLGEVVATFGLLLVILGVVRSGRASTAPLAVGGYIAAAYWFTSSTSFANPAVTAART